MQDHPLTGDDKNAPSNQETIHANLDNRLGVLFGVIGTLLGGTIGALSGKLLKKFSPAKGFVWGTVIAGAWASTLQIISFFRVSKTQAPKNPCEPNAAATKMMMLDNSDCDRLKDRLAHAPRTHVEPVLRSREQTPPARS